MQGVDLYWCLPRVAIVASADRLEMLRRAVVESAYWELELRQIESDLATRWPELEAHAPQAFEFRERDLKYRDQLAVQFRQLLLLRSRLAKITPWLRMPPAYPATLSGQIQERLRERLAVHHRVESLEVQLEVFERIYDGCGQRVSEFVLARRGHTLEWIIIILLALQTVFVVFEWLTNTKS